MNKYEPGFYHVVLFDRFGGKVDTLYAENHIQGIQIGEDVMEEEPCNVNSFVVMRVNYNSLMKREWK